MKRTSIFLSFFFIFSFVSLATNLWALGDIKAINKAIKKTISEKNLLECLKTLQFLLIGFYHFFYKTSLRKELDF